MSNHHDEHHDNSGELHFEQIQHAQVKYDDRDLGARGIIGFLVVLAISIIVLCVMVWGYFNMRIKAEAKRAPAARAERELANVPKAFVDPVQRFPKPTLQIDDVADMNKFREQNEIVLNSYGWVDQKAGVVHIPIEQAIDILAKQGLPTRTPVQQSPVADFGSGNDTVPGIAGGTRPENNK